MSAAPIPTLKALLWKDWRLARSLLIAAAALYITPLIVGGVWLAIPSNTDRPETLRQWLENAGIGCFMGLVVSFLATPMFGAIMFARERRDRTGELVGSMPIRRGPIVLSKAIILFILTVLPWLVTALAMLILWSVTRDMPGGDRNTQVPAPSDWKDGLFFLGPVALSIGSGWLFSSFVSRDTIAAGLSFFVTLFTISLTFVIWARLHPDTFGMPSHILSTVTWSLGLASFIAGTIIALRRKTP